MPKPNNILDNKYKYACYLRNMKSSEKDPTLNEKKLKLHKIYEMTLYIIQTYIYGNNNIT